MTFRHSVAFTLTVPLLCALLSAQTHKEKADLLVSGGTVVTMDASADHPRRRRCCRKG